MTISKFPPNLSHPKTLLYELAERGDNLTNVIVIMTDNEGSFKFVTNEYDASLIALGAAALQGLASELVWAAATESDILE